ncbi:importin subunit beta-5 [Trichomonascus vanleenenianus]|uniref:karyopherin KAP114 n=1 Tax=Trichomonascus vanleenenianus TaxID=2268995 RepID=UPI003ECB58C1
MSLEEVLVYVRNTHSPEAQIRESSEAELDRYRSADPDSLSQHLLAIGNEPSLEINVRQSALMILKAVVLRSWNIGFTDFQPPAIKGEVKTSMRETLLQLINSQESKIRSAASLLVAKIASVDFPEEWPQLLDVVLGYLARGDPGQVQGGLTVLQEILYDALSSEEYVQIHTVLLPAIYEVAVNESHAVEARALAIECFKRCINFYQYVKSESDLDVARRALELWVPLFNRIASMPLAGGEDFGVIHLKQQTVGALRESLDAVAELISPLLESVLMCMWESLSSTKELYASIYVDENNQSPQLPSDLSGEEVSLENVVESELEFISTCIETKIAKKLKQQIRNDPQAQQQFIDVCVTYAQLHRECEEANDVNVFIAEESEVTVSSSARVSALRLFCSVESKSLMSSLWGYFTAQTTWQRQESCTVLLEYYVILQGDQLRHLGADLTREVLAFVANCRHISVPAVLKARGVILAGAVCAVDSVSASDRSGLLNTILVPDAKSPEELIRAAAIMALQKIKHKLSADEARAVQKVFIDAIGSLVEGAEDETPSFLAESLGWVLRFDYSVAIQHGQVVELLFSLVSKDTANIELTSEATELFEDLIEYCTDHGQYGQFSENALVVLLTTLNNLSKAEYSSDLSLTIGFVSALIEKGPTPLPDEVTNLVLRPMFEVFMSTDDVEILQNTTELFTYLVEHASERLKAIQGREMVLEIVSKLLDPACPESATINAGGLISIIITKFGQDLGEIFSKLLQATAVRLADAHNLLLTENLVSVFCDLVLKSPSEVVNILWDIKIDDQGRRGLEVVLTKWLETFDILRGYEVIRKNIVALQELFVLNDDRIKSIIVDGDVVVPEGNVIITRSKAKNAQYTRISVQSKIIKLLIAELSNSSQSEGASNTELYKVKEPAGSVDGTEGYEADEDDDDWEEIDTLANLGVPKELLELGNSSTSLAAVSGTPRVDNETQRLITEWFEKVAMDNVGGIREIVTNDLTSLEKQILYEYVK